MIVKNGAMVVDVTEAVKEIQDKLKGFENRMPTVLAKAVNETARKARVDLAEQARKVYAVKDVAFEKQIKLKNATKNKATAILMVKSAHTDLNRFNATPVRYSPTNRPAYGVKVNVLNGNSQKELTRPSDGVKAFIVKYKSGHVGVAQRKVDSRSRLRKIMNSFARQMGLGKREDNKIKTLYGPTISQMLGNIDRVYGVVEPDLQSMLQEAVKHQIDRELHYQNFLKTSKQ